jgi:hypothetical protein
VCHRQTEHSRPVTVAIGSADLAKRTLGYSLTVKVMRYFDADLFSSPVKCQCPWFTERDLRAYLQMFFPLPKVSDLPTVFVTKRKLKFTEFFKF